MKIRHDSSELNVTQDAIDELVDFMHTCVCITYSLDNAENREWFKRCSFFDYFCDSMTRVAPYRFVLNTGNYDIEYNNSTDIRLEQMWQSAKMHAILLM